MKNQGDKLGNFIIGLDYFKEKCNKLQECSLEELLHLYGKLSVLVNNSINQYSNEIAYPAQNLQIKIEEELKMRVS